MKLIDSLSILPNVHLVSTYVQKCMQWHAMVKMAKITSLWRFELDAKSGPLKAGDFGEIGDFGIKIARGLAICGKIFKLDARSGPFKVDN